MLGKGCPLFEFGAQNLVGWGNLVPPPPPSPPLPLRQSITASERTETINFGGNIQMSAHT